MKLLYNKKIEFNSIFGVILYNLERFIKFLKFDRFYEKGIKINNFFLNIKYNVFLEVLLFFSNLCENFIIGLVENTFRSYFEIYISKFLIRSFNNPINLNLRILQQDKYKLDSVILKEYMVKKIKNNIKVFIIVRSMANLLDYMLFLGQLKGYQVRVGGRLTKNPRSRTLIYKGGKCEMGRGLSELNFNSFFVRTKTGLVGVKIWLNYGISNYKNSRNKREVFKKKEKRNMKFRIKYNT